MLTDKQREERKTGIGGSDAAAVCGLSRFKTPFQLYLDKIDDDPNHNNDDEGNERMHFGNVLEDIIAKEYSHRSGNEVYIADQMFRHKDYPWMIANVDRLIFDKKAILECKTAGAYSIKSWGESYTDDFPVEYLLQCAHYAIVLDVEFVDLAVLIGGNHFRIYTYKRNDALEIKLIEKEKQFWHNHVLSQIPPEPIFSEEAAKVWSHSINEVITANQEIKEKINELALLKNDISKLMNKKDEAELFIKSILREKEGLADEYGKLLLTWKNQQAKRFDVKSFQRTHPNLYEEFLRVSSSRVLRLRSLNNE